MAHPEHYASGETPRKSPPSSGPNSASTQLPKSSQASILDRLLRWVRARSDRSETPSVSTGIELRPSILRIVQQRWAQLRPRLVNQDAPIYLLSERGDVLPLSKSALDEDHRLLYADNGALRYVSAQLKLEGQLLIPTDVFTSAAPAPSASPPREPVKNQGGAPRQYDSDAFIIQACWLLYDGYQPKNQSDFRRKALEAFAAKTHQEPSDDWAKPRIRRIWNEFGLNIEAG